MDKKPKITVSRTQCRLFRFVLYRYFQLFIIFSFCAVIHPFANKSSKKRPPYRGYIADFIKIVSRPLLHTLKLHTMPAQILTSDDLREFKVELFNELRSLFGQQQQSQEKPWLKSAEVRKLLNISPGTLHHLRLNGTLPFTKMGGTLYFNASAIEEILSKNQQVQRRFL